ncbi:RodZ domain-containing protein [Pigmentiphaga litoralis]
MSVEASAAPLRIVIGNVKGVDAQWRRAPLDMSSARRDNVARMTLN